MEFTKRYWLECNMFGKENFVDKCLDEITRLSNKLARAEVVMHKIGDFYERNLHADARRALYWIGEYFDMREKEP